MSLRMETLLSALLCGCLRAMPQRSMIYIPMQMVDVRDYSLKPENGKLQTLEYFVSKATELNDMMDPSKGSTGDIIYSISEVHIDDEHLVSMLNSGKLESHQ